MQDSGWTSSDILGTIFQILGLSTAISNFIPGANLIKSASGLTLSIASQINSHVSKDTSNYMYTNNEKNRIKLVSNYALEYQKDLRIIIPEIEIGTRTYGYFWNTTEATMSNLYVVLELE